MAEKESKTTKKVFYMSVSAEALAKAKLTAEAWRQKHNELDKTLGIERAARGQVSIRKGFEAIAKANQMSAEQVEKLIADYKAKAVSKGK